MSLRLIEVFLPEENRPQVESLLNKQSILEMWCEPRFQNQIWVRILVNATDAEGITDQFSEKFEDVESFRLLLLEVEASVPPEPPNWESPSKSTTSSSIPADLNPSLTRLNREEIYDRVSQSAELSWVQLAMVSLSTVIAAIGILEDNQAVVIGAMVIAPLLKPNMALAVATTLGDRLFAMRAVRAGLVGISLSLIFSVVMGYVIPVSLESSEIASRIRVSWPDGILALASGVAGAISLTTEERSSIVGVMVSVALLPPLVVLGLLLGAGYWPEAFTAGLLVTTNLICLNLAAVTTFLIQDLRPRQAEEVPKAKEVTRAAYGIWLVLLMGLVGVILTVRFYEIQPY